ncbi:MAG: nucleotide exchange factor GrpE [Candidatus Heimdallarchaeota archaeon]|nr:nucleotide exchange factor GrpE [Candidatus Heimdallarchaeota archaeon]MCK4253965.1 nucleotide exchange factor GrpE [Candidatus Heimdallarchaeota archaeon]
MSENEKTNDKSTDDLIEVDVDDIEDITEVENKEPEKVDSEKLEMDKTREEFQQLIAKNKTEKAVEKYMILFKELKQSNNEKNDYLKTAQMVQANFENYKKRAYKDQEWSSFQSKMKIVERFLSFYDDLDRSVTSFNNDPDIESLKEALNLVFGNLKATFESLNVKTIEPEKEIFNPQYHEAIHIVENEEVETNTIVDVVSIGFILEDVVIKPAKVVITRKTSNNSESK